MGHKQFPSKFEVGRRPWTAGAVLATFLGSGALSVVPAAAQNGTPTLLPETVVSASREPVNRERVGSAVSVLTELDLRQSGNTFLTDNLRDLPSMYVSRSGGFGALTEVRLRGSENNHVLVFIDGMRMNDPAFGNAFDFGQMLNFGIRRLEVLRGPQSGLYGPDALAGVISIETPEGKPGLRVEGFSEVGSYNTFFNGGRVSGGIRGLTFSFTGTHFGTKGANNSRTTAPGFAREEDEASNTTLIGKIKATPFPWLELMLAGRYVNTRLQFDADTNFDGLLNDADRVAKFESLSWIARARIFLLDRRWVTTVSVSGLNAETENLANGAFTNSFDGRRLRFVGQTAFSFDTPGLARARHKVILAVEHERQEFQQIGLPFFGLNPNQRRRRNQTGFVAEYRLALWDALFLSAAVRYDINSVFDNTLTYRGTAAYVFRDWGTRLHASIGRGVKNPTFIEQFGFFPDTFVGNPNLRPESSVSFDVGVEQKFWSGRVVVDLTYFDAQLKDEINGFVGIGGGLATARNVGGLSRRRGFELSLVAKPFDGLTIRGQYTYLVAQQAGAEEIRRPRHSGAISVNYAFLNKRANVNVAFRFNGKAKDLNFGFFPARRVELGGYVLMTVAASYKIHKYFEIYGRIENALDQRYEDVFSFRAPRVGVFAGVRIKLDLVN